MDNSPGQAKRSPHEQVFVRGVQAQPWEDGPGEISTAVPQLLYPEATAAQWDFPQENATFRSFSKGT